MNWQPFRCVATKKKTKKKTAKQNKKEHIKHRTLMYKHIFFNVPKHIKSNKEKKEYKAGYLNELYLLVYPDLLKKQIYQEITNKFQIFVDERQFQNLTHEYSVKKYSNFIKK